MEDQKDTDTADWTDACAADDIDAEDVIRFDRGPRIFVIVVEAALECRTQASSFEMTYGKVATAPACENLHTYPTKAENSRVLVEI